MGGVLSFSSISSSLELKILTSHPKKLLQFFSTSTKNVNKENAAGFAGGQSRDLVDFAEHERRPEKQTRICFFRKISILRTTWSTRHRLRGRRRCRRSCCGRGRRRGHRRLTIGRASI
jgi:hypothetical protein